MSIRALLIAVLSVLFSVLAVAQEAPAGEEIDGGTPKYIREETPAERRLRVGDVDPGLDPDPDKVFQRKGQAWKIERFDRRFAAFDVPEGYVRPMANVNFAFELYQMNDKYVWAWMPTVEELKKAAEEADKEAQARRGNKYTPEQVEYLEKLRGEFVELTPADSPVTVRFENSSEGLPSDGSWRHSATFADMNGDGHVDIIAPPERGSRSIRPVIFLGDGKGNWSGWHAAVWPYPMDYGSVVPGDFNGDGKTDLAFGMNLIGPRVLLNNGDGRFIDASEGMTDVFPTRRVAAADVDNDGDLDLLAIYEGGNRTGSLKDAKVRAYINEGRATKWRVVSASGAGDALGGDWLAVGKFNNDRYPDFIGSSNLFHGTNTLFQSKGPAKWESVKNDDYFLVPLYSFYTAVDRARLSSKKLDDAIVAYQRMWPGQIEVVAAPGSKVMVGIDRISFAGKEPQRVPVIRYEGRRPITGLATADFDGDGKLDILFTRFDPREAVLLLGDGKGRFRRGSLEGMLLLDNPNYDITVGDVNGDGRPDVLVMYESTTETSFGRQNGAIRLFLNRGPVKREAVVSER